MLKNIILTSLLIFPFASVVNASESCYSLGYKQGSCIMRSMKGMSCKAGTDIVMPERCRNTKEGEKGIKDGMASEK